MGISQVVIKSAENVKLHLKTPFTQEIQMDTIKRFQNWFFNHCDNDWEHDNKISIYNLDNPGWGVRIDLSGTLLEEVAFDEKEQGNSEDRNATWIKCNKQESVWLGLGSYDMLNSILNVFLDWADANTDTSPWDSLVIRISSEINALSKEKSADIVTRLRNIYAEIDEIPTEHPKKRELLSLFNDAWQNQWK